MRLERANPIHLVGDVAKAERPRHPRHPEPAPAPDHRPARPRGRDRRRHRPHRHRRRATPSSNGSSTSPSARSDRSPAAYAWVVLGSQARLEQGPGSDQDNALVLSDDATPDDAPWFEALATLRRRRARRVRLPPLPRRHHGHQPPVASAPAGVEADVRAVDRRAGARRDPPVGDLLRPARSSTATARSSTELQEQIRRVGAAQQPLPRPPGAQRRRQRATARLLPRVRPRARGRAQGHGSTSSAAASTRSSRSPACMPCREGCRRSAPSSRITAAAGAGGLSAATAADLHDAFEFIRYVRLLHQAKQIRSGEAAGQLRRAERAEQLREAPPARRLPDRPHGTADRSCRATPSDT